MDQSGFQCVFRQDMRGERVGVTLEDGAGDMEPGERVDVVGAVILGHLATLT